MQPTFFATQNDFRAWLKKHHKTETELVVGFYKVDSGKPSLTWPESVDQALCYGWIDGVRNGIDEVSYKIRFTPRKPTSIWSAINIAKMEKLIKEGLMTPAGLDAYKLRNEKKSAIYSYEKEAIPLSPEYETIFKKHVKAWTFFIEQPPGYKKQMIYRVMGAKQKATQLSRLEKLIEHSKEGKRML